MRFFAAVQSAFYRAFQFSGRSSRSEYWYYFLFNAIAIVLLRIIDFQINGSFGDRILTSAFHTLTFIIQLSLSVRRLHDIGRSGKWLFLILTIIGMIPLLYWACKKGSAGENQYGKDPLANPWNKETRKRLPKWSSSFAIPLCVGFVLFCTSYTILMNVGVLSDPDIIPGSKIPYRVGKRLESNNTVLSANDILYFYANDLLMMSSGWLLTKDRIVAYVTNNKNQLEKYELLYKNIENVELVKEGDFFTEDIYEIDGKMLPSLEDITISLPVKHSDSKFFTKKLLKLSN